MQSVDTIAVFVNACACSSCCRFIYCAAARGLVMLSPHAPDIVRLMGPELSSQSELRLVRIAAMGALVAALSVAGCGRKSGLDPPPGATAADTSVSRPDLSRPDPSTGRTGGEPVIGPDGRVIAPSEGPKRSTPIDWLLN
jgi:predicted small lipoprotein YifL